MPVLSPSPSLQDVLKHPAIWRGSGSSTQAVLPSGHVALDAELPGGGWGLGQINELLHVPGLGELRLLWPALRQSRGRVVLVAPPWPPYAPAWAQAGIAPERLIWVRPQAPADVLWALEQTLAEPDCAAALGWWHGRLDDRHARRLQLAARRGQGAGFLLRQGVSDGVASPFPLRVALDACQRGLQVRILKRRGLPLTHPVLLTDIEVRHALAGPALTYPSAQRLSA
ncbi:translesion DNA synthesis-associated protein ImuA [Chitinolyticbacter meiyuanensis]|uniref:translesion DNA synthesis-associated protein ImuA n=1 Tax=Chitinolyticbacter meiyuanensis TaxID=682798 RepID=UPI0011E5E532|nr:translesion DNA synthesis-associated protein ImuA [Chitinolyticbacter meiyuanensis]